MLELGTGIGTSLKKMFSVLPRWQTTIHSHICTYIFTNWPPVHVFGLREGIASGRALSALAIISSFPCNDLFSLQSRRTRRVLHYRLWSSWGSTSATGMSLQWGKGSAACKAAFLRGQFSHSNNLMRSAKTVTNEELYLADVWRSSRQCYSKVSTAQIVNKYIFWIVTYNVNYKSTPHIWGEYTCSNLLRVSTGKASLKFITLHITLH